MTRIRESALLNQPRDRCSEVGRREPDSRQRLFAREVATAASELIVEVLI
jgi:hypothetical protein